MLGSLRKSRSRQSVGRRKSPSIITNSAAPLQPMKHRQTLLRFRRWLNVGLKWSKPTAILYGQAERPAAGLTHCFPFLFCPILPRLPASPQMQLEFSILSQSGERPERWAEAFINTTLSKLEHNWDHRPTADAKSGPEETSAPSRDCAYGLA